MRRLLLTGCLVFALAAYGSAVRLPRRVLTQADLVLEGGFRLPLEVSAFSAPGLAVRHLSGETRLFVTGHRLESDPIFEVRVPALAADPRAAPRAPLVASWGTGRKIVAGGNLAETRGLQWHANRLYMVYQEFYNVTQAHNPILSRLDGPNAPAGPWTTAAHSHLTGGYITEIPQWYADTYLGGKRLAVGSPLVSGNSLSSWGPNLEAIATPADTHSTLKTQTLVRYSYENRAPRPNTYTPLSQPPDRPGGWWTQQDFLHGVAWVDTGTVHGVIFSGALAAGNTWYGKPSPGRNVAGDDCGEWIGPHAEDYDDYLWVYDPMTFAPVSKVDASSIRAARLFQPNTPLGGGCLQRQGLTWDPVGQRLYVISLDSDTTVSPYPGPVVYVFRVASP